MRKIYLKYVPQSDAEPHRTTATNENKIRCYQSEVSGNKVGLRVLQVSENSSYTERNIKITTMLLFKPWKRLVNMGKAMYIYVISVLVFFILCFAIMVMCVSY